MLKQNKFFSIISITGTALAIMMIMAIIVTDSVKNVSVAPENNRNRTLYLSYQILKDSSEIGVATNTGPLSLDLVRNYILQLKTPELISVYTNVSPALVGSEISTEKISLTRRYTDPAYWKILSFSFLEGKTFNEEEFHSGICNAIISNSAAKKLFKGESAIGRSIDINSQQYRVIGIVKDISPVFTEASADIWTPYTSINNINSRSNMFRAMLMIKNKNDITAIKGEFRKIENEYQGSEITEKLYLRGPDTHRIKTMGLRTYSDDEIIEQVTIQNRKIWFILIVILLVPAVNLSGLNLSRIKKRTPEIGVRKAFGAKRHIILIQVLFENLITSFIGGIIGLVLSVFVIFQMKNYLLKISPDSTIPFDTIVSIPVIISIFTACIIINILSAAIPAYRASHMTIVNSITNNDK